MHALSSKFLECMLPKVESLIIVHGICLLTCWSNVVLHVKCMRDSLDSSFRLTHASKTPSCYRSRDIAYLMMMLDFSFYLFVVLCDVVGKMDVPLEIIMGYVVVFMSLGLWG